MGGYEQMPLFETKSITFITLIGRSTVLSRRMAEDLADEIVRASRGMPTMELAIVKKRLDASTRLYHVSGVEEGQVSSFTNFADANNYLHRRGFNRILDGAEGSYWKEQFLSMMSTSSKGIEAGVLIYTKSKYTEN